MVIQKIQNKISRITRKNISIENYFNVPIKVSYNEKFFINERIIESAYIIANIDLLGSPKKILNLGCARNWLSITLSSYGHKITGVDLRDYPIDHINFQFDKGNILDFNKKDYDFVISISTIEHIGLGVYGAKYNKNALKEVFKKVHEILKIGGKFIFTTPVGLPSIDTFERSFSPEGIKELISDFDLKIEKENYYYRKNNKYWLPCSSDKIKTISNSREARDKSKTGVNGIGCFVAIKQ